MRVMVSLVLGMIVSMLLAGWIILGVLVAQHFNASTNLGGFAAILMACLVGGLIGLKNPHRKGTRWMAFRNYSLATFGLCACGCLLVVSAMVAWIVRTGLWDSRDEVVELAGAEAQQRLKHVWPMGIDPKVVVTVSRAVEQSRDSFSGWWRVKTTAKVARQWTEIVHLEEANKIAQLAMPNSKSAEGVRRTLQGRIPLGNVTGNIPVWWHPHTDSCEATEGMLWYADGDTGVARAIYSTFDASSDELWVYEYACQHDLLWSKGSPPDGRPLFSDTQHDQ